MQDLKKIVKVKEFTSNKVIISRGYVNDCLTLKKIHKSSYASHTFRQ